MVIYFIGFAVALDLFHQWGGEYDANATSIVHHMKAGPLAREQGPIIRLVLFH